MPQIPCRNPSRLLAEARDFLHSFVASKSSFALVPVVRAGKEDSDGICIDAAAFASSAAAAATPARRPAKTLFVLDSSFNPPSRAHFALALAAVRAGKAAMSDYPEPHALLLLLSTANADKAPSPAAFEQRLAMMACLGHDLSRALFPSSTSSPSSSAPAIPPPLPHIGLTTQPYYSDKSDAISSAPSTFGLYAPDARHVHIMGHDTLIRFLAPRYYTSKVPEGAPPLTALRGFFDKGHGVLVAPRPDSASGLREQREWVAALRDGSLEDEGFRREWGAAVRVLGGDDEAARLMDETEGVSSTAVREAIARGDDEAVGEMCTEGVAAWVMTEKPYAETGQGRG